MADQINQTQPAAADSGGGLGTGMIIGIIIVVLIVGLLLMFGFSGRNTAVPEGDTINLEAPALELPSEVDVNINEGAGVPAAP